jgi:hypothetical protein
MELAKGDSLVRRKTRLIAVAAVLALGAANLLTRAMSPGASQPVSPSSGTRLNDPNTD